MDSLKDAPRQRNSSGQNQLDHQGEWDRQMEPVGTWQIRYTKEQYRQVRLQRIENR